MSGKDISQINFFLEISKSQILAREFFSNILLESIERNFGFKKVLITYFDTEGNLLSCLKRDDSLFNYDQRAFEKFTESDVVRDKVYNDAIRDSLTYFNIEPRLYKSTDVISIDYEKSDYLNFIKRYCDSYYSTTMAFGINAYIQIVFFKSFSEGDFTQEEIEQLNKIYVYVANSYKTFKKHEQMKIVSHIQSEVIALEEKAYVIFDYFMNVMNYNQTAEEHLKDILDESIVKQLESGATSHWMKVLFDLELEDDKESDVKTRVIKNHIIKIHTYNQCYSNGIIDKYYWITISKKDEDKSLKFIGSFDQLTQKEQKVAELMYNGLTYKAIADELVVSYHTVKKHVENIYTKCGVKSRFQLSKWLENQELMDKI